MVREIVPTDRKNVLQNIFEKLNVVDIEKIVIESLLIPYLYFCRDKENIDCLMITDEGGDILLEEGTEIIHLLTREMTRELEGEKYVNRCYKPIDDTNEEKTKIWEDNLKEGKGQKGYVNLLIIKPKVVNEWWQFVTFETFNSLFQYWLKPFKLSNIHEQKKVVLKIKCHKDCKKESKNNFSYFAHYLFLENEHYEVKNMTEKDVKEVKNLYNKKQEKIKNWLDK